MNFIKTKLFRIKLLYFALIFSVLNLVLYHLPFYKFVFSNTDSGSFNGILLVISLTIFAILLNALLFYLILFPLRTVGKWILSILFNVNAISLYFINTYNVIIERTMIGNVFNTNFEEASSFFSFSLVAYVIFLGIIPCLFMFKIEVVKTKFKQFLKHFVFILVFLASFAYVNSNNWLWIDKNSKTLGALVMPLSYLVNTYRFFYIRSLENKEQILLPEAKIKNNEKAVAVLVIGESARSANFSLYGYKKNTNPLLSKIDGLHHYKSKSCATYTTAGVKCILSHKHSGDLYEILPNYLFRNNVEVIWRTTNWGEPTVKIDSYQTKHDLSKICETGKSEYDEVLLSGLKEQILNSKKNKIFIVLHTSTSHGPTYYKKYTPDFEVFTPVCRSVELSKCSQEELINAYDNTIVYTDYILAKLISELKQLEDYKTSMIYISDHGESLGENNLYMHGIPVSIAPKEQLEIPFIVWSSDNSKRLKEIEEASQHSIFHSILDFLSIESDVYDEDMSVFN